WFFMRLRRFNVIPLYTELPLEKLPTMSLNGTGVPRPSRYCPATTLASPRHGANAAVSDGLIPDGRKKLSSAGGTNAPAGPTPQVAIVNGLLNSGCALATAQAFARSHFSPRAFGLAGFTLIGRLMWCPPV